MNIIDQFPKVIFVQPFTINAALAEQCGDRVVVLDVAFNAGSKTAKGTLQEQFENTTLAFIKALGDRLIGWVDHHPHDLWKDFGSDPRFHLYPREFAPACPPIITPQLIRLIGDADTIIAHGDFDGVMSAAKWALGGAEPYKGADQDAVVADTRKGKLSKQGQYLEEAMKADLKDDNIRAAVFYKLVFFAVLTEANARYKAIGSETKKYSKRFKINGSVAVVCTTGAKPVDMTQLLLAGQKLAEVAVVWSIQENGSTWITIAGPQGWNFVQMFGLNGGMPNRVNLPGRNVDEVIAKINSSK